MEKINSTQFKVRSLLLYILTEEKMRKQFRVIYILSGEISSHKY